MCCPFVARTDLRGSSVVEGLVSRCHVKGKWDRRIPPKEGRRAGSIIEGGALLTSHDGENTQRSRYVSEFVGDIGFTGRWGCAYAGVELISNRCDAALRGERALRFLTRSLIDT